MISAHAALMELKRWSDTVRAGDDIDRKQMDEIYAVLGIAGNESPVDAIRGLQYFNRLYLERLKEIDPCFLDGQLSSETKK